MKSQNLITIKFADSVALKNGLSNDAKPFSYQFGFSEDSLKKDYGKLEFHVIGQPYDEKIDGNKVTKNYLFILLDLRP